MGSVYVWLDRKIIYTDEEVKEVLGLQIDEDLQNTSRYDLCNQVEKTLGLDAEAFWHLHSTQKIRFAVQTMRNLKEVSE